jgi:hypothetical protein
MTRLDFLACLFGLSLLALAFSGCGGLDTFTAPPTGLESPAIDSGATPDGGAAIDGGTGGWWAANLGQGMCGEGYTQKLYAPNDFAWCEGSPDAGGAPCGESTPIGWYRAGLYKCAKVQP